MMDTSTHGHGYRRGFLSLTCVALATLLSASCSTPAPGGGRHNGHHPQGNAVPVAAPGTTAAPLAAADLALRLESLLGEHSVLAANMMRGRIRGDEDFAQAANAALGKNT